MSSDLTRYRLRQLITCLLFLYPFYVDAADRAEQTRNWVVDRLQAEIDKEADLNIVSSLLYPLASTPLQYQRSDVRAVLEQAAYYLDTLMPESLGCGELADLKLSSGFLAKAGIKVESQGADERLRGCNLGGSLFDSVNALIYYCRYSGDDHQERVPGALAEVEAVQLPNGAFSAENGRPWYYLTSHAVIAIYYCGGDERRLQKGQQRLLDLLPRFYRAGFIDGLAESLIFLQWMEVPIPGYQDYLNFLRWHIQPDGGICFKARPGCRANWHATSLLLELENLERYGKKRIRGRKDQEFEVRSE